MFLTYFVSIAMGVIGVGLLASADSTVDYLLAAAVLVMAPVSAWETGRRSRATKQPHE